MDAGGEFGITSNQFSEFSHRKNQAETATEGNTGKLVCRPLPSSRPPVHPSARPCREIPRGDKATPPRKQVRPHPRFLRARNSVFVTRVGQSRLQETAPSQTRLSTRARVGGVTWDKIKDMCVMRANERACPSSLPPPNYPRYSALRTSSVIVSQRMLPSSDSDRAARPLM